ncbi:hypothetical protein FISHEDRAFT_43559 [Fistulina hepatica ATCC 64428]|uniref:ER transporter 6TM N-terminal domain-containing protein n=1 Tax=Fistulina hepatica ATCC 64428 TaxID=1128425 RepID=A0A0D7AD94_9AGAR|nr:hypothetical protein FISHEDRAFT_43559 [Fistulina hepatica ATCC 64428]
MSDDAHKSFLSSITSIFAWVGPALHNRRTLKTWLRTVLVLAACCILFVDHKTLDSMGNAGFFAAIVAFMIPPSMAFPIYLFVAITLLLGMLLGWAWGAAAMASASSVRNQALLQRQYQQMIMQCVQLQLTLSSAVFGAFLFIGTYVLALIRARAPKLAVLSIFASIVLDINCSYGALFPTAQYTNLSKLFLIPSSYCVAISLASLVVIFPQSLNHVWLSALDGGFCASVQNILSVQTEALATRPSDNAAWSALAAKGRAAGQGLNGGMQGLLGLIKMIDLEFSVCCLGPKDLKTFARELQSLTFRATCLLSFQRFVDDRNQADAALERVTEAHAKSGTATPRVADRMTRLHHRVQERERRHGHGLDDLVPILADLSADLRSACESATRTFTEWCSGCRNGRWIGLLRRASPEQVERRQAELVARVKTLEDALAEFQAVKRKQLLKPYEKCFDPQTGALREDIVKAGAVHPDMFSVRSLFTCFVFSDALEAFAERLIRLMQVVVDIDRRRPNPRLWAPTGLRKLWKLAVSRDSESTINRTTVLGMGTSSDPTQFDGDITNPRNEQATPDDAVSDSEEGDEISDSTTEQEKPLTRKRHSKANEALGLIDIRNPDALPPTTSIGRLFVHLGSVVRFLTSANAVYALRYAIVSIALWIPQICHNSAWFVYENKGIWALIMAQTSLAVYAGDQIANYVDRMLATVYGLVLGMAFWYIGAGHGTGNPYGVVVATTVLSAPIMFGRIAAPPRQTVIWLMTGVTIVLIVGYSWIDDHLIQAANVGVGVTVGWKRTLLVMIGFTAGFIVMIIPRPSSSRLLVRRTLAGGIGRLGFVFAAEIETLLVEEARHRAGYLEKVTFRNTMNLDDVVGKNMSPKEIRVRNLSKRLIDTQTRLQGLMSSLQNATWEPQVHGVWPKEKYLRLHEMEMKLLSVLTLMVGTFSRLDTKWCSILVRRTPFLNPSLLSDVFSNIAIISHALRSGRPLPGNLPKLRDRVVYHERHLQAHGGHVVPPPSDAGSVTESDELDFSAGKVDGSSIGFEQLSLQVLMEDQLPVHSTGVYIRSVVECLVDQLTEIVGDLCGTVNMRGFDLLQDEYIGSEERAVADEFAAKMTAVRQEYGGD